MSPNEFLSKARPAKTKLVIPAKEAYARSKENDTPLENEMELIDIEIQNACDEGAYHVEHLLGVDNDKVVAQCISKLKESGYQVNVLKTDMNHVPIGISINWKNQESGE